MEAIHMKRCRQCHQVKLISEFSPLVHGRLGVATQCKACCAERQRAFRATHPHYTAHNNQQLKQTLRQMRRRVIARLGDHCAYCGETTYRRLDIHRKTRDDAQERTTMGRYAFYRAILTETRPTDDLIVVCKACHRALHPRTYARTIDGPPCPACGSRETPRWGHSRVRADGTRGQRYRCTRCGRRFSTSGARTDEDCPDVA